ncbi:hypothetical protein ERJ75_000491900 [Trypanosoma vivax]|nr:hypothetical protein ERJ75_000491900 [Trypanosoma vivax]
MGSTGKKRDVWHRGPEGKKTRRQRDESESEGRVWSEERTTGERDEGQKGRAGMAAGSGCCESQRRGKQADKNTKTAAVYGLRRLDAKGYTVGGGLGEGQKRQKEKLRGMGLGVLLGQETRASKGRKQRGLTSPAR